MYPLLKRIQQQLYEMILGAGHQFVYLNAWKKQDEQEKKMKEAKQHQNTRWTTQSHKYDKLPEDDNDAVYLTSLVNPNSNIYRRTRPRHRMFSQKLFKEEENMGIELMSLQYNTC
jgi:hypothetical protein